MSKLAWFGFAVLVANTAVACWLAWSRFATSRALDSTTTGQVVGVTKGSGRTPNDYITASYTLDNTTYKVRGNSSEDSSLNATTYAPGAQITVYYSSKDPAKSALSPTAGFSLWSGVAALLLLATGYAIYIAFFKR